MEVTHIICAKASWGIGKRWIGSETENILELLALITKKIRMLYWPRLRILSKCIQIHERDVSLWGKSRGVCFHALRIANFELGDQTDEHIHYHSEVRIRAKRLSNECLTLAEMYSQESSHPRCFANS